MDPAYGMHYTGQVLDLDSYLGTVRILNTIVKGVGIRYETCDVATMMVGTDPATLTDSYPGYGTKSKYQIKAVISIVNQEGPV